MKKRAISFLLAVMILLAVLAMPTFAAWTDTYVYVTVAYGDHKVTYDRMKIIELVADNVTTVHEVLYTVHELRCDDPVTDYYRVEETEYGKSITKMWGVENGSGYGYYVNDVMGTSLDQAVNTDDHVYFYVYTDTVAFSDTYAYFDKKTAEVRGDETVTLTLMAASFDENWNPVNLPVKNATITFDGEATEYKTDEEGKVTFPVDRSGKVVVSALSEDMILVPPICLVKANASYMALGFLILGLTLVVGGASFAVWYFLGRKKENEA